MALMSVLEVSSISCTIILVGKYSVMQRTFQTIEIMLPYIALTENMTLLFFVQLFCSTIWGGHLKSHIKSCCGRK